METLSSAKGIQAAVTEETEQRRLRALNETLLSRVLSQQLVGFGVGTGSTLLSHLTTATVFVVGGQQVIEGELTVGTLIAFVAYLTRGSGSALSMMNIYLAYQRAAVSLGRVRELWSEEIERSARPAVSGSPAAVAEIPAAPEVEFRQLTYRPAGAGAPLFEGFDWIIPGGTKVALTGDSGAGKSSLTDLLRRFVVPESGEILIAGVPIERYDLRALRRAIVVLEAKPTLFRGTILFNLRYGHPDASEQQTLDVTKRAGLDDIVAALPEGYETVIGTGGAGLSAGQCQRIAIARALLARPAVLVLDEATNSLDENAVRSLHEIFGSTLAGVTQIVITHAAGRVPGAGTHWQLSSGQVDRRGVL